MSLVNHHGDEILLNLEFRLWKYTDLTLEGHILWTGHKSASGRGMIRFGDTMLLVHRAAAMLYMLNFDSELLVLHKVTCHTPLCINVSHLYQGNQSDNMRDAVLNNTHNNARKTHCPKGHEYTEKNTRIYKSMRTCRTCDNIRSLSK